MPDGAARDRRAELDDPFGRRASRPVRPALCWRDLPDAIQIGVIAPDQLDQDRFLGFEVVIQASRENPGGVGDLLEGGAQSRGGDQRSRRFEDLGSASSIAGLLRRTTPPHRAQNRDSAVARQPTSTETRFSRNERDVALGSLARQNRDPRRAEPLPERRKLRIAIIGAGPGGLCMAIRLKEAGFERLRDPREGERRRRHLVPQPLPGLRLRHPVAPLLVLLRDQARLVAALRAAARDPRLPRSTAPRSTACCPHCRFGDAVQRAAGTRRRRSGRSRSARAGRSSADVVVSAIGMFNELACPTSRGSTRSPARVFHSARWNAGPRPLRRDGRRDRQRGERRAVRARDREAGRRRSTCSSARRTGCCRSRTTPTPRSSSSASAAIPALAPALRRKIFDSLDGPRTLRRGVRAEDGGRRAAPRIGRASRTRSCARSSRPTIPGAASARSSRTTTTPRSTGRTSSSSPTRSSASPPTASSPPTAASAGSTR